MKTTEPTFQKLMASETVLLTKIIMQHARTDELNRIVIWNDGWDDARALKALTSVPGRHMLTVGHVTTFRKENFGYLETEVRKAAPKVVTGGDKDVLLLIQTLRLQHENMSGRITMLEGSLADAHKEIADLQQQLGRRAA